MITAYNVAHAMFSGTAPIVQTALVLSSPDIAAQSGGQQTLHPMLNPYYLLHDGRLRPAYYMILVSIVSFLALSFGAPYCERRRRQREETRCTEAAIEAAFGDERIPNCFSLSQSKLPSADHSCDESYAVNSIEIERLSV
jgi:hypothetical protein